MATTSPERHSRETRFSARRRPNVRLTSENVSDVKSMRAAPPSGRRLLVELGVHALERGHQVAALDRVLPGVHPARTVLLLERGHTVEELLALCLELAPPAAA